MTVLERPRVRPWTRDEYYRIGEMGLFDGQHVELIEGDIVEMCPIGTDHSTAVGLISDTVKPLFSRGFIERVQQPLDLGEISEPEPDVVYVAGRHRDFKTAHPTTASLIVEVSESSLSYDRTRKASLYARAGVQDYWILNLLDRRLEVMRDPVPDASHPFGWGYNSVQYFGPADSVSPLAVQSAAVRVADLLP